jgi:hypothetical protein
MRLPSFVPALCGALAVFVPSLAAMAQTIPDYLVHRVPTARDPGPLAATKTISDYILEGYTIVLRTEIDGRFEGCRKDQDILFEDRSRFECSEDVLREEISPPVRMLVSIDSGKHVLFIGTHAYVGRLLRKKGVKLSHIIHIGDAIVGIPIKDPDERRSIGPVDVPNGKIPPIPDNRSYYAGTTRELSAGPPNPPPASVTLNPVEREAGRRAAAVGLAHPQ